MAARNLEQRAPRRAFVDIQRERGPLKVKKDDFDKGSPSRHAEIDSASVSTSRAKRRALGCRMIEAVHGEAGVSSLYLMTGAG